MAALATGPDNSIGGPPVLGNQGGGSGDLTLPHKTNFDMTMTKNIPLGRSEKRVLKIQAQAYNVFNHPEITGIGTGIRFNPTTNIVSNASSLGYMNGTLPARVLAYPGVILCLQTMPHAKCCVSKVRSRIRPRAGRRLC